jgi:lipoate synthase
MHLTGKTVELRNHQLHQKKIKNAIRWIAIISRRHSTQCTVYVYGKPCTKHGQYGHVRQGVPHVDEFEPQNVFHTRETLKTHFLDDFRVV